MQNPSSPLTHRARFRAVRSPDDAPIRSADSRYRQRLGVVVIVVVIVIVIDIPAKELPSHSLTDWALGAPI
jgi:hypothetical protein